MLTLIFYCPYSTARISITITRSSCTAHMSVYESIVQHYKFLVLGSIVRQTTALSRPVTVVRGTTARESPSPPHSSGWMRDIIPMRVLRLHNHAIPEHTKEYGIIIIFGKSIFRINAYCIMHMMFKLAYVLFF